MGTGNGMTRGRGLAVLGLILVTVILRSAVLAVVGIVAAITTGG